MGVGAQSASGPVWTSPRTQIFCLPFTTGGHAGTISATTSTSVFKLAITASTTNDYYNGKLVTVGSETRTIADYVGATRQVTITGVFGSSPSGAYHIASAGEDTAALGCPDVGRLLPNNGPALIHALVAGGQIPTSTTILAFDNPALISGTLPATLDGLTRLDLEGTKVR